MWQDQAWVTHDTATVTVSKALSSGGAGLPCPTLHCGAGRTHMAFQRTFLFLSNLLWQQLLLAKQAFSVTDFFLGR